MKNLINKFRQQSGVGRAAVAGKMAGKGLRAVGGKTIGAARSVAQRGMSSGERWGDRAAQFGASTRKAFERRQLKSDQRAIDAAKHFKFQKMKKGWEKTHQEIVDSVKKKK